MTEQSAITQIALRARRAALAALFALLCANAASADDHMAPRPFKDDKVHEGVYSCYGSTCHSRQAASGAVVRQNEILTWQDKSDVSGAHSRAYLVLLEPRSELIARNLGIGKAHEARECLACHTDYVEESRRGEAWNIEEGVACEACHGGAEDWLKSHYSGDATHADNVANGLYPTEEPKARARLCMSCHFGSADDPDQFVDHRIMGAGHPRLSFELDLFTALQQHHTVDDDYRERKSSPDGVKVWAVGQAIALEVVLENFTTPGRDRDGVFPELVFFDCHACHQPISDERAWRPDWRPNPARALGPGIPTFNDANLIMLRAAAETTAPDLAKRLTAEGRAFHRAVRKDTGRLVATAEALEKTAEELVDRFNTAEFDRAATLEILRRVVDDAIAQQYTNYAGAEQAVIAVDTLLSAMIAQNRLKASQAKALRPDIDAAYAATSSPNTYDQTRFRQALGRISASLARV